MSLAENVKMNRLKLGYTQQKLANEVNLTKTMISFVESGKRELSINSLREVAKVFNCTIDELVN
ncbi:MAG: helix-turn-helix transcriptional regulator [Clostridiales bacterium]|nr:helix-turn-helix transcriptional regulator [Clostridiales bacterium]